MSRSSISGEQSHGQTALSRLWPAFLDRVCLWIWWLHSGAPQASVVIQDSMDRCQELVPREDLGRQVKVCRIQALGTEVTSDIDYLGFNSISIYLFICSFT